MKVNRWYECFFPFLFSLRLVVAGVPTYAPTSSPLSYFMAGTTVADTAVSIIPDSQGNVYVCGHTNGNYEGNTNSGSYDVFLSKFDTNGNSVFTKLFGTIEEEGCEDITIDSSDQLYVTGYTKGVLNSQNNAGAEDIFMMKIDSSSGSVLMTKVVGSTGRDDGNSVVVDSDGNIYVGGYVGAALNGQSFSGGSSDSCLLKFNSAGVLQYTKLFGGAGSNDWINALAVDTSNNIYTFGAYSTGSTSSSSVTVLGSTLTYNGGNSDVLLAKFDSSGNALWCDLLGGTSYEDAKGLALDSFNNVYLSGFSNGVFESQSASGGGAYDIYLARYNSQGSQLYTVMYGGSGNDYGLDLVVANSLIYLVVQTSSSEGVFSTGTLSGSVDSVLVTLSTTTGSVQSSTPFVSSGSDYFYDVAVLDTKHIFVVGATTGSFSPYTVVGSTDTVMAQLFAAPTAMPTPQPSYSLNPTVLPTIVPSLVPSEVPTASPSYVPTTTPTYTPSGIPTTSPTASPSASPTASPSASPSVNPSTVPTVAPTMVPSFAPTSPPSPTPSLAPTTTPAPSIIADAVVPHAPTAAPSLRKGTPSSSSSSTLYIIIGAAAGGALLLGCLASCLYIYFKRSPSPIQHNNDSKSAVILDKLATVGGSIPWETVINVASALPIVGDVVAPLCTVLSATITLCDNVNCCTEQMAKLQQRLKLLCPLLLDTEHGLLILAHKRSTNTPLVAYVDRLEVVVRSMQEDIEPLASASFFDIAWKGAAVILASLTEKMDTLTELIQELQLALSVDHGLQLEASVTLQHETYALVEKLDVLVTTKFGGLEKLLQNEASLQELCDKMEVRQVETLRSSIMMVLTSMETKLDHVSLTTGDIKEGVGDIKDSMSKMEDKINSLLRILENGHMSGMQAIKQEMSLVVRPVWSTSKLLGQGTFANVYAGVMDGHEVAVKVFDKIHGGGTMTGAMRTMIMKEAACHNELAKKIPGVLRIYGADVDADVPFIVMERAQDTLQRYVYMQHPSVYERISVLCDVAVAMSAVHRCNYLHRDLKPENILLVKVQHVYRGKLSDFGFAKQATDRSLAGSELKGTLAYLAPELFHGLQQRGDDADGVSTIAYGPASDVYAFGVTMNSVMSGLSPSMADGYRLRYFVPTCSAEGDLLALIQQATAANPAQRPSFDGIAVTLSTIRDDIALNGSVRVQLSSINVMTSDIHRQPSPATIANSAVDAVVDLETGSDGSVVGSTAV